MDLQLKILFRLIHRQSIGYHFQFPHPINSQKILPFALVNFIGLLENFLFVFLILNFFTKVILLNFMVKTFLHFPILFTLTLKIFFKKLCNFLQVKFLAIIYFLLIILLLFHHFLAN